MKIRQCFTLLFFVCCCFIKPNPACAQLSSQQILKIVAANDLQSTIARLDALIARYPSSPELLFLRSTLEVKGAEAFKSYSRVYSNYKSSRYAPDALMKIAQFNYAKGDYERARVFYSTIVTNYPNAENRWLAQLFAARTLLAQSKLEFAESELKRVAKKCRDTVLKKLVDEDLAYIETLKQASNSKVRKTSEEKAKHRSQRGNYAVQIGSYSRRTNALNQVQYFGKLGYSTEIITYKTRNGLYYRVIIGRYETEKSARINGEKFNSIFKKPYRIIKL